MKVKSCVAMSGQTWCGYSPIRKQKLRRPSGFSTPKNKVLSTPTFVTSFVNWRAALKHLPPVDCVESSEKRRPMLYICKNFYRITTEIP